VANNTIVWPAGDGEVPSLIALRLGSTPRILDKAKTVQDKAGTNDTESAKLADLGSTEVSPLTEAGSKGWTPDGIISVGEYSKNLTLSDGKYVVHWRNTAEDLYMALSGKTEGFVAIGFEPSQAMKDADMVMGWVSGGKATVLDLFSTGTYGPHPPDGDLGGKNDILEFGGSESDGWTVIEFQRKMDTGDQFDKSFKPGQTINIIWSMSASDALAVRHNVRGASMLALE
jgi:hypothetical protein